MKLWRSSFIIILLLAGLGCDKGRNIDWDKRGDSDGGSGPKRRKSSLVVNVIANAFLQKVDSDVIIGNLSVDVATVTYDDWYSVRFLLFAEHHRVLTQNPLISGSWWCQKEDPSAPLKCAEIMIQILISEGEVDRVVYLKLNYGAPLLGKLEWDPTYCFGCSSEFVGHRYSVESYDSKFKENKKLKIVNQLELMSSEEGSRSQSLPQHTYKESLGSSPYELAEINFLVPYRDLNGNSVAGLYSDWTSDVTFDLLEEYQFNLYYQINLLPKGKRKAIGKVNIWPQK